MTSPAPLAPAPEHGGGRHGDGLVRESPVLFIVDGVEVRALARPVEWLRRLVQSYAATAAAPDEQLQHVTDLLCEAVGREVVERYAAAVPEDFDRVLRAFEAFTRGLVFELTGRHPEPRLRLVGD